MALSEKALTDYSYIVSDRFEAINTMYLKKMAKQIKEIGQLGPSNVRRLNQMAKMSQNLDEINKYLAAECGMSVKELYKVYDLSGMAEYEDTKKYYDAKNKVQTSFKDNSFMQDYLNSVKTRTGETFRNISNTTASLASHDYLDIVDTAVDTIATGVGDYQSVIRDKLRDMAASGLRVQYESGRTRRLDSAIRMNILEGVRQINNGVREQAGKEYGADGVEISAHGTCATDHLDVQGKQFTNEQFEKVQANLKRKISTCNCRHIIFPIVVGVSEPAYSAQELKQLREDNTKLYDVLGKEMTRYQASQLMRKMETEMRYAKDLHIVGKEAGDDVLVKEANAKLKDLRQKYNAVADSVGLRTDYSRAYVPGFGGKQVAPKPVTLKKTKTKKSRITQPKGTDLSTISYDETKQWFMKHANLDEWLEFIEDNEYDDIISKYSGEYYSSINHYLRTGEYVAPNKYTDLDDMKKWIDELDEVIKNFELTEDITVYRASGTELFGVENLSFEELQKFVGEKVTDKGFFSASTLKSLPGEQTVGGKIKYTIDVAKGKGNGAYIARFSENHQEREFLLRKNSSFKVQSVTLDEGGFINVHLTQLPVEAIPDQITINPYKELYNKTKTRLRSEATSDEKWLEIVNDHGKELTKEIRQSMNNLKSPEELSLNKKVTELKKTIEDAKEEILHDVTGQLMDAGLSGEQAAENARDFVKTLDRQARSFQWAEDYINSHLPTDILYEDKQRIIENYKNFIAENILGNKSEQKILKYLDDFIDLSRTNIEYGRVHKKITAEQSRTVVKDLVGKFREVGIKDAKSVDKHIIKNVYEGTSYKKCKEAITAAYDCYPSAWIEDSIVTGEIQVGKISRGYYSHHSHTLMLSGSSIEDMTRTATHELGHRFERTANLIPFEKRIYNKRTAGDTLEWLGSCYRKDEKTRKDNWLDAYMGKDYGGSAYELVSMGFELAFNDVERLLEDEEFANFIFSLLTLF